MNINDKQQHDAGGKPPDKAKRKHVGDETPNPLPDGDYTVHQPAGDDNPSESSDSGAA